MSDATENLYQVDPQNQQGQPLLAAREPQREQPVRTQPPTTHIQDQNRGQPSLYRPEGGHPVNNQFGDLANQIGGQPRYYPPAYYQGGQGGPQHPYNYANQSVDRIFPERPDVLIPNNEPMDARPQNPNYPPKAFVLHERLGPFVTPTGPATINIDRLQPYLDYLTVRIPKELESTGYKLYLLWIWLYVSLTLIPVVLLYVGAYHGSYGYDFAAIPIEMASTIHWAVGIYQAHYVQKTLGNKQIRKKKYIEKALEIMKYYLMGLILMITIMIGCTYGNLLYVYNGNFIAMIYGGSLIFEAAINYFVALKIEKHLKKYERFQELVQNHLQDAEKSGIYYRYVYELLELISDEDFLYPIKRHRRVPMSKEEMVHFINGGLTNVADAIEDAGHVARAAQPHA